MIFINITRPLQDLGPVTRELTKITASNFLMTKPPYGNFTNFQSIAFFEQKTTGVLH